MEALSGGVDWATSQDTSQLKVIAREEDTPWGYIVISSLTLFLFPYPCF